MKINNIFVAGAYFATDKDDIDIYEKIAKFLRQKYPNKNIFTPNTISMYRQDYKFQNPTATETELNKAMVDYDLSVVKDADLIIADITNKSTGLGIELGYLKQNKNKTNKIVFLAKENVDVSSMILGAFSDVKIFRYNFNLILDTILKICQEYIK